MRTSEAGPAAAAATLLSTGFGCGYSPVAPGTVGSAAAVAAAVLLGWQPPYYALLAALVTAPGIWASGATARLRKTEDPQIVVIDEVLGQWLALSGAATLNWKSYLGAFVLFRIFDIWKPAPVRRLERLPGGVGIVADDLMAGLYAALVLFLAGWFNLY
ncbi:MAG: phosphatidylglycerophosphatase A [Acidobacteria bacterium]|nr:phosphatidylglycerophosphatase A [Acidobacteriota bacterium]